MNSVQSMPQQFEEELKKTFSSITLEQLDNRAALLERTDNKYIVSKEILNQALEHWADDFNMLEIEGRNSFLYDNVYFDDESYTSFNQHGQGKRTRFKVRTRQYVDNETCFVEVKLKGVRGRTVKRRMIYRPDKSDYLDSQAIAFIHEAYLNAYDRPFTFKLLPALRIQFQRITLVAIEGHERMTIDTNLQFSSGEKSFKLDSDVAIIETKTVGKHGVANKILSSLHQHSISGCSKYCIGLALLGEVKRYNRFLKAMRKLRN